MKDAGGPLNTPEIAWEREKMCHVPAYPPPPTLTTAGYVISSVQNIETPTNEHSQVRLPLCLVSLLIMFRMCIPETSRSRRLLSRILPNRITPRHIIPNTVPIAIDDPSGSRAVNHPDTSDAPHRLVHYISPTDKRTFMCRICNYC